MDQQYTEFHFNFHFSSSSVLTGKRMKNAPTCFSGLSGHSGSKKYEILAHDLFSFAGWTCEK